MTFLLDLLCEFANKYVCFSNIVVKARFHCIPDKVENVITLGPKVT